MYRKMKTMAYISCILHDIPIQLFDFCSLRTRRRMLNKWSMSIWIEAVAILPQLSLLQRQREVENLTSNFVFAMGAYRGFYIINWMAEVPWQE
mmetsp:Transcript_3343/g.2998  ORF Transcript_3343/g.2998 Transcript_3343/m.2998 type:complete len:93 (-) Transcript_3343:15-293(-)